MDNDTAFSLSFLASGARDGAAAQGRSVTEARQVSRFSEGISTIRTLSRLFTFTCSAGSW
jgi:hypothetical protein